MKIDEWVTTTIMAKEWGCTPKTILRLIKSGDLPAKKKLNLRGPPGYRVLRDDWETYKARKLAA